MVKAEIKIQKEPSKAIQSLSPSSSPSGCEKKKKKYKGVRRRSWGSWVSEIRAPNQKTRIWLGSYSTAEAAARAYDAALLCLKGTSANLNFPLTSPHCINIDVPTTHDIAMSPKSIQRVAAAAAAAGNSLVDDETNAITTPSSSSTSTTTTTTETSLVSSPDSMVSSPSDGLMDDDVSVLMSSYGESMAMMEPWYVDQMLSGAFFDLDSSSQMVDDLYEEGEIRLWSFC